MNARTTPAADDPGSFWVNAAFAVEAPDYVRFAEDRKAPGWKRPSRPSRCRRARPVDLVGVVHIADASYYQELNRRFDAYDSVLFELVGDPTRLTDGGPLTGGGTLSTLQQTASDYLNLTFQLGAIDYTKKNMVHADATAEEFDSMQRERGESTLTLFVRAMQAQMNGEISSSSMRELDTFGLIRILMSEDSATEFKKALAKSFDQMESMTAAMEGKNGSVIARRSQRRGGEQDQGSAGVQEATPHRGVLRRRAHAGHRGRSSPAK